MTAKTEAQLEAAIRHTQKRVDELLDDLVLSLKDAIEASHERVVGEGVGKITKGSHADPTFSIVSDRRQAGIRKVLERVPKKLVMIENDAAAIGSGIRHALDDLDPREGFEALRFPRTASDADLEAAREAQGRRERGEGTG